VRLLWPFEFHHAPHAAAGTRLHHMNVAAGIAPDAVAGAVNRIVPTCQLLAIQREDAGHAEDTTPWQPEQNTPTAPSGYQAGA